MPWAGAGKMAHLLTAYETLAKQSKELHLLEEVRFVEAGDCNLLGRFSIDAKITRSEGSPTAMGAAE